MVFINPEIVQVAINDSCIHQSRFGPLIAFAAGGAVGVFPCSFASESLLISIAYPVYRPTQPVQGTSPKTNLNELVSELSLATRAWRWRRLLRQHCPLLRRCCNGRSQGATFRHFPRRPIFASNQVHNNCHPKNRFLF